MLSLYTAVVSFGRYIRVSNAPNTLRLLLYAAFLGMMGRVDRGRVWCVIFHIPPGLL